MDNSKLDPSQIQQMITLLQTMLEASAPAQNTENEFSIKQKPAAKQRKSKKKKDTTQESSNKFLDMPEMHMHKEDCLIDKKLIVKPPVPRTRKFQFIEAICNVCGKKEKVNPILLQSRDRYKCNKCSTSAG
jgi:hypothetical protein